jgi:hypothetical protein
MTPKDKAPGLDPAILQTLKEVGEMIIGGKLVKYGDTAEVVAVEAESTEGGVV